MSTRTYTGYNYSEEYILNVLDKARSVHDACKMLGTSKCYYYYQSKLSERVRKAVKAKVEKGRPPSHNFVDYTGQQVGTWLVIMLVGKKGKGHKLWFVQHECGAFSVKSTSHIKMYKSCSKCKNRIMNGS